MRAIVEHSGAAAAVLLFALTSAPAAGQDERPGLRITADAVAVDLSGRVQLQSATTSCSDFPAPAPCAEQVPGLDLFMRRVRLSATATIDDLVTAKVEPDYGDVSGVVLRDAYARLDFAPGFRLQAGQFKKPVDGFELTSSSQLLTIERDLDIPGVAGLDAPSLNEFTSAFRLASYDIGVMANGALENTPIRYWAGVFNGEPPAANGARRTEKQLAGRLQYTLRAGRWPLDLAVAATSTQLPFTRASGELDAESFTNVELWGELGDFEEGLHVQAGVVLGDNPLQTPAGGTPDLDDPAADDLASMAGWQVIGTYKLPVRNAGHVEAVEPLLRISYAEPNTEVDDDEAWGVTPGVQLFFSGRNKVSVNWDFVLYASDALEDLNSFKVQLQAYF